MIQLRKYELAVIWSEEDQCWIGSCKGLISGSGQACHGDDPKAVFNELVDICHDCIDAMTQVARELRSNG